MGDRELTRWVSDKLHDVLGFSDSATAQFVVALARKTAKSRKGPAALLEGLAVADVPTDNATSRTFAKELMSRCVLKYPQRVSGLSTVSSVSFSTPLS